MIAQLLEKAPLGITKDAVQSDPAVAAVVGGTDIQSAISYVAEPPAGVPMPPPTNLDARFYGTTELPNVMEKAAGTLQDKLHKE